MQQVRQALLFLGQRVQQVPQARQDQQVRLLGVLLEQPGRGQLVIQVRRVQQAQLVLQVQQELDQLGQRVRLDR